MSVIVNKTERKVSVVVKKAADGKDFKYEDFTPEQLEALRGADFTFEDFTPEQLADLKFSYEDFTPEQIEALKVKGDKGDPFVYEDFTQAQKDAIFNTYLSNFYSPSIVALHSRGVNEGATFERKLHAVQDEVDETASLQLIPSVIKAGKLYSVLPEDGSGDFTVDRNSTATRTGKDGLIKLVPANTPRIDYSTGEPMLLVEGQSTNFIAWSEDFSKSWTPISVTEVAQYGNEVLVSNFNQITQAYQCNLSAAESGKTYSASIYLKGTANSINKSIQFRIKRSSGGSFTDKYIDTVLTNEWQLLTIDGLTLLEGNSGIIFYIYGTNGTANEVYLKHPQLEEGSKATSYIPTNGSIVTRLADNIHNILPASGNVVITFADGTTQTISGNAGDPFTLPNGLIEKVEML